MRSSEIDDLLKRITYNPGIFAGKAIIRDMSIRVIDILELLASGMYSTEILDSHPYLEADDIRASLYYAAKRIKG